jgi:hypothetical protein
MVGSEIDRISNRISGLENAIEDQNAKISNLETLVSSLLSARTEDLVRVNRIIDLLGTILDRG